MTVQEALRKANPCDGGAECKCEPGNYYVSCVDGPDWWIMAGPYPSHAAAVADKRRVQDIAFDADPRAWWKSWGTVHMANDYTKPGRMNQLGLLGKEKAA